MSVNINNVYIFIADSLRLDYIPKEVRSKGILFKTVAQGGMTAISMPSIATGLLPQQHGVSKWGDKLPDGVRSILRADSMNTSLIKVGKAHSGLSAFVGVDTSYKFSDIEPPFICIEHNNDPHMPHAGFETQRDYLENRGIDTELVTSDYQQSITDSQQLFNQRLDQLNALGILDETLVVFTSDHGELLGEHGELDHGSPICPEIAYVPTVFIHPQLTSADFSMNPSTEIIEHIDITATVNGILDRNIRHLPGTDILSRRRKRDFGYCYSELELKGHRMYLANSIWWHDSGYVFTENALLERLMYIISQMAYSNRRHYLRCKYKTVLKQYLKKSHSYGDPPINKKKAYEQLSNMLDDMPSREAVSIELSDDDKQELKALGYRS